MPHTHEPISSHDEHHAHHHDSHDLEERNRAHWDKVAKEYEYPASAYLTANLAQGIYDRFLKQLDNKEIALLDYACGPGLVSYKLLEEGQVKKIVGADVSDGMVEQFNLKAKAKGFTAEQAHAVIVSNHGLKESLQGELFDVVMCNHAYHHFDDVKAVTATLSSALKPGGILVVADFLATEKPFVGEDFAKHAKEHGVHHTHGFKAEVLQKHFEDAGLVNVKVDSTFSVSKVKLKELGGGDTSLGHFLKDADVNPEMMYVLACGQKAA
ncbi:S-adenosyl-L-methionine-dependent methyltransferase [Cystobasidium minutum MCA 4210]|uniref:S-adenosyl-L-methionine-dependent methyltransferase n=1 Tax=Cystobasidium minutum MCA 4210 TaxID=1397322 RepID=UPI0034CDD095|eukprot:jgi/Rhomi1/40920/CE40919_3769